MAVQGFSAAVGLQRPSRAAPAAAAGTAAAAPPQLHVAAQLRCTATNTAAWQRPSTARWPPASAKLMQASSACPPPLRGVHTAFMPVPGAPAARPSMPRPAAAAAAAAAAGAAAHQAPGGNSPTQQKGPKAPPPAEARAAAAAATPRETFRVVGVSFDGRQELLAAVGAGHAVMLVREPHNPHDPNAVAVLTLHGHGLGYIPREQTFRIPQQVTFGRVESIGTEANTGNLGLVVSVQPLLPALTVDAIPESLMQHTALSSVLPDEDWDTLRKAAYRRAGYKCEITGGAGADYPVVGAGVWHVDDAAKVVKLLGVAALAPEVNAAKSLARLQPASDNARAALATLQQVNGWSPDEADTYLRHLDAQRAIRSGDGWALDVSWLEGQGITVPPALAALSRQ